MRGDGQVGDDSDGQIRTDDNQLEGYEVYGENHSKNDEVSTARCQGKFLWEFSTYS